MEFTKCMHTNTPFIFETPILVLEGPVNWFVMQPLFQEGTHSYTVWKQSPPDSWASVPSHVPFLSPQVHMEDEGQVVWMVKIDYKGFQLTAFPRILFKDESCVYFLCSLLIFLASWLIKSNGPDGVRVILPSCNHVPDCNRPRRFHDLL